MPKRKEVVIIRFRGSALESKRLAALSKLWELTPSATLRRILGEAYTMRFGSPVTGDASKVKP